MRGHHGLLAVVIMVLLSLTAFSGAISFVAAAPAPQGYPGTATTIRINNDVELANAVTENGWAGDGTFANPYVIAGSATTRDLDMEGGAFGIYIANITSKHFYVMDWHIYNSSVGDALTIININTPFLVVNLTINDVMNGVVVDKTTDNSAIRHVSLNNISWDGIRVGNSSNFYIENNDVNNAYNAIRTIHVTRSYVRDNVLTDAQGSVYNHHFASGVMLFGTTWTTVSGNDITEINMGIYPQFSDNNIIEHNRIFECAEGIYLDQASNYNLVQYNEIFNITERAIALNYDATQTTVAYNVITNCSWEGIYSVRSVRANIHDNVIVDSVIGIAAVISSTSAQITNNWIEGSEVGILLSNSNLSSITNNYIANSTQEGLVLQATHDNTVQNNYLYNNDGYGIMAEGCTDSSFNLNLLSGNNGATSTYDVDHVQAFDDRTTNVWDGSSLGNYWLDWTSPDADGDSIVDVPYAIDGGSMGDEFPLAYPVGMVKDIQGSTGYIWAQITWSVPNYSAAAPLLKYVITRTNGTDSAVFETAAGVTQLTDTTITWGITYNYSVVAVNKYGQSGAANASLYIIPSNLAFVTITAPMDEAMLNTTDVNVVWQPSHNAPTITGYQHRLNGGEWIDAGLSTSHLFNASQGIVEGSNTVDVNVTNPNGSSISSVQFTVDLTAPEIQILQPANNYLNTTGNVLLTWQGSDANGIVEYQLMVDSGTWQNKGVNESAILALADGNHAITVKAIDSAGNFELATVNVTVDTTRPLITNMNPSGGSLVDASGVTFSWDIVETGSGVNRTNVSIDSGAVIGIGYGQSFTTGVLAPGEHTFSLIVFDNASFNSSIEFQFTAVQSQVTGTVQDAEGNPIANATVNLMQGTTVVVDSVTDAEGEFALTVDGGVYNLTVAASGFEDLVRTDQSYGVGQNNTLGVLTMTPVNETAPVDYTLLIVGVIVVLAIIVAALYLFRRRKV